MKRDVRSRRGATDSHLDEGANHAKAGETHILKGPGLACRVQQRVEVEWDLRCKGKMGSKNMVGVRKVGLKKEKKG